MGELTIAKSAGFCFGVTRAVNMVYEAIEKENVPIYTYGPIIHNDEVVKDMLGSMHKRLLGISAGQGEGQ